MPNGYTETESLFNEWFKTINSIRQLSRFGVNSISAIYKPIGLVSYLRSIWQQTPKFKNLMSHANYRRLARTHNGYLCLVPESTREGDCMVLCMGGRVPLIMRRTNAYWTLQGESYVHGLMNGTAFEESRCESILVK
jgi:hypothetical protein